MTEHDFLQSQVVQFGQLLELADGDPVLSPQFRSRLGAAQQKLEAFNRLEDSLLPKENVAPPRAAIFVNSRKVEKLNGIRPTLAGNALILYESMFVEQALHDEREDARAAGRQRRPRGAARPELLFTGTPRGSFGMEFVAQSADESQAKSYARSLTNVASALQLVAESEPSRLEQTISSIPRSLVPFVRRFFKILSDNDAEIRLAFPDERPVVIGLAKVKDTAERLVRDVSEERLEIPGDFRGLTRDSGYFDLRTQDGTITGMLAEELAEEDIERIAALANLSCVATIEKRTVKTVSGSVSNTYVLIDAYPEPDHPTRP